MPPMAGTPTTGVGAGGATPADPKAPIVATVPDPKSAANPKADAIAGARGGGPIQPATAGVAELMGQLTSLLSQLTALLTSLQGGPGTLAGGGPSQMPCGDSAPPVTLVAGATKSGSAAGKPVYTAPPAPSAYRGG